MQSIAQQTVQQLGGPGSVLARQKHDHVELDHLLHQLDATSGTELGRVVALLHEDVRDEEDVLLPRLQATLSPARQRRLGAAWELVAKSRAPRGDFRPCAAGRTEHQDGRTGALSRQ